MSDVGGNKNAKGNEDFIRAIAKISIAQIFENEGFHGVHQSAVEAIANVAVRYVTEIGKVAKLSANSSSRFECNVFDILYALEDLGSIRGFHGVSDVHRSVESSGVIRELRQYMSLNEEIPFVYSLPRFPVSREYNPFRSSRQLGEEPSGEHIPVWLPAFPNGRENDEVVENKEDKVLDKEELPLLVNGSLPVFGMERGDSSKMVKKDDEVNPFIAPPLLYGEKEVSLVDHLSSFVDGEVLGNHVNGMGSYGVISEAGPDKLGESKVVDGNIGSTGRPVVQLKFNSTRKSLSTSRNVIARNNGDAKLACYFGRDDEIDEMKQRAELVVKESLENPLGPAQL